MSDQERIINVEVIEQLGDYEKRTLVELRGADLDWAQVGGVLAILTDEADSE